MGHQPCGSAFWHVWALLPLLAGLFVVERGAPLPPGGQTAVQVGIVLFIYELAWLWLRANTLQLPRRRIRKCSVNFDRRSSWSPYSP